jgi:hypothetical protein
MTIDKARIHQLFKERPRHVRGLGRTTAALYRALERVAGKPGMILFYPIADDKMSALVRKVVEIANSPESPTRLAQIGPCQVVAKDGGAIEFDHVDPRDPDVKLARYEHIADDLGEFADMMQPQRVSHQATRLLAGLPPIEQP